VNGIISLIRIKKWISIILINTGFHKNSGYQL
jgi:hypothetical protein